MSMPAPTKIDIAKRKFNNTVIKVFILDNPIP